MSDYWVYILQNLQGRYYVGLSDDPLLRLVQHNAGLSRWTRPHRPWTMVWQSGPLSLGEARKLENRLKRQGRGQGFYSISGLSRPDGS
jgi:putative endonuclease